MPTIRDRAHIDDMMIFSEASSSELVPFLLCLLCERKVGTWLNWMNRRKKNNKGKRVILAIKKPAWGDDPLRGIGMLDENKRNSSIDLYGTSVTSKFRDRPGERLFIRWVIFFPLHVHCKPRLSLAIGVPFIHYILPCTPVNEQSEGIE